MSREAYTWVPRSSLDSVRAKGLMTSESMLSDPEALANMAASRGNTPEEQAQQIREALGSWRSHSVKGVNVMSHGPPEGMNLPDNHPTKRIEMVKLRIALGRLMEDRPDLQLQGSELVPYNKEDSERLGDDYADVRHHELTPEELDAILARTPEDLWSAFDDMEGTGKYAPNVPHIAVQSDIPAEYIEFPEEVMSSEPQKARNLREILGLEKQAFSADKGCLMLQLPDNACEELRAWKKKNVPADQVVDDEDDFHTTVLYGFDPKVKAEETLKHLQAGPMKIGLGKIKRFPAHKGRPESDALVLEAHGWKTGDGNDEIRDLNGVMAGEFDVKSKWKYNPHVTLAYVKPGALKELEGEAPFDGEEYSCSEMVFSTGPDGDRDRTSISLVSLEGTKQHWHKFCLECKELSSCRCRGPKPIGLVSKCWTCEQKNEKSASQTLPLKGASWIPHLKLAWDRSGDVLNEVTNGRPYPTSYVTGEGKELLEEIGKLSPSGIREESSDVLFGLNMLGHQATGLNLPMVGGQYALEKFRKRNSVWKKLMEEQGVPFSVDYLAGGSNFHKPHKIQGAFAMAGKQLSDEDAARLSQQAVEMESGRSSLTSTQALLDSLRERLDLEGKDYFMVMDGASMSRLTDPNSAARNARAAHVEWEKARGIDPTHDWSVKAASNLSGTLYKAASPRMMKMLAAGLLKSPKSLTNITRSIPAGVTRQVGKASLGEPGMEGIVHRAITGGRGESAVKTFFDQPRKWLRDANGDSVRGPWSLTGGDRGIQSMMGVGSTRLRARLMEAHPEWFPKVYGTHPRGYVVERLEDIGKLTSGPSPLSKVKAYRHAMQGAVDDVNTLKPHASSLGAISKNTLNKSQATVDQTLAKIREIYKQRHTMRAAARPTPAMEINERLKGISNAYGGPPSLPFRGRSFDIHDVVPMQGHNVMRTAQGRAVISDPIIGGFVPKYPPQIQGWGNGGIIWPTTQWTTRTQRSPILPWSQRPSRAHDPRWTSEVPNSTVPWTQHTLPVPPPWSQRWTPRPVDSHLAPTRALPKTEATRLLDLRTGGLPGIRVPSQAPRLDPFNAPTLPPPPTNWSAVNWSQL